MKAHLLMLEYNKMICLKERWWIPVWTCGLFKRRYSVDIGGGSRERERKVGCDMDLETSGCNGN